MLVLVLVLLVLSLQVRLDSVEAGLQAVQLLQDKMGRAAATPSPARGSFPGLAHSRVVSVAIKESPVLQVSTHTQDGYRVWSRVWPCCR